MEQERSYSNNTDQAEELLLMPLFEEKLKFVNNARKFVNNAKNFLDNLFL